MKPHLLKPLVATLAIGLSATALAAPSSFHFHQYVPGLSAPGNSVPLPPVIPSTPALVGDGVSKVGACTNGAATGCATWDSATSFGTSLSMDSLTATVSNGDTNYAYSTKGVDSGKWYWEVRLVTNNYPLMGLLNEADWITGGKPRLYASPTYLYGSYTSGGAGYRAMCHGVADVTGSNTFAVHAGDVIGYALDATVHSLRMYKNGVLAGTLCSNLTGTVFPIVSNGGGGTHVFTANFGQSNFAYPVPAGYNAGLW